MPIGKFHWIPLSKILNSSIQFDAHERMTISIGFHLNILSVLCAPMLMNFEKIEDFERTLMNRFTYLSSSHHIINANSNCIELRLHSSKRNDVFVMTT